MLKALSRLSIALGVLCCALWATSGPASAAGGQTGTLRGSFVDQKTGAPVVGASVTAISASGTFKTQTDAHGFFVLLQVPTDTYELSINKQGYSPQVLSGINTYAGELLMYAGRTDDAFEQLQHTLKMDPDFLPARSLLAFVYLKKGDFERAIAESRRAAELPNGRYWASAQIGFMLAVSGRTTEALRILPEVKSQGLAPTQLAVIYSGLGDKDRAFELLEQGYRQHAGSLILLKVHPVYDPLRSDPRFKLLTQKVGLP